MFVQIFIAVMVYMMVQAVMFFTGVVLVPATPLADMAMKLMPWVVAITSIVSLPVAWLIALRLRARYWREKGIASDVISGPSFGAVRDSRAHRPLAPDR